MTSSDSSYRQSLCSRSGKIRNMRLPTTTTLWILCLSTYVVLESQALPHPRPQAPTADFHRNFAVHFGAPLISPLQDDVTVDVNSRYTLRCEAGEPIEWKTPPSGAETYKVEPFDTLDAERPHGSLLQLSDITVRDVGYYYCIKKSALEEIDVSLVTDQQLVDLVNNNQASNIYIYVHDKENLLVPIDYSVGYAHQYEDIIIPCKPSVPTVEVLLTTPNDQTYSSENTGRYDPKRGFIVEIRGLTDTGLFSCRPKVPALENEEEETQKEIYFDARTNFINRPKIISDTNGHAFVGDTFKLKCEVTIAHDVRYSTSWTTPPGVEASRIEKGEATFTNQTATHRVGSAVLTVKDARKSDEGLYKCHVQDQSGNKAHTSITMTILRQGETYLNVSEPSGYYNINVRANNTIQMNVKYRGYPMPTLEWYKSDGTKIDLVANKYDVNTTATASTLKITKAQMVDTGEYVVRATNGINSEKLKFQVSVNDTPIVTVQDVYVQEGGEAHVTCKVLAYPAPFISWLYTPCSITPRWPSCNQKFDQSFNSTRSSRAGESNIEYLYDLYFTPEQPGIMHCVALNTQGKKIGKGHVLIGDISDNMTVYGVDENDKIARGDEVMITCAALAYFYTDDLRWFKDGVEVEERNGIIINTNSTDYSYKKTLKFKSIRDMDRGSYECRGRYANDYEKQDSKYINIFVHEPLAPRFTSSNLESNKKIERKLGEPLELDCKTEAIPRANVIWYKDNVELVDSKDLHIEEDGTKLLITFMHPEDEGVYKCFASNRMGSVEASGGVEITNLPRVGMGWALGIFFIIVLIVLVVAVIVLWVLSKRKSKLLRELKAAGLANFEEGAVEHINPALTLDEQADLLPYDRNFEFPREKLKLGKQLGAGAFGVVLKAHAEGIKPEERESVVAVKMVKRTADNEVMRALVSELKIMVHLGQHLNVVNLLGAVTKSIAKRELMVIVEYCRFGNIQNFLLRNRKRFIDQINPNTDRIDPTITTQRFSDNFEVNRSTDSDPRSGTRAGRPNSRGYLRQSDLYEGHVDSCATEQTIMTTVPEDEDNVMSNNSVQPAWRSNYKPDSTEAMTITTSDLVSWAFQVARGMDYLSSRKVLHGDLAARNILLCEDNVVKICDFGLARSMYKGDNYKKQGEAPLPIKWLALESLSDHIFSTYTDVWSFGIVLWEFFSLAKVPYPGMDPNQNLYLKLKDGYRMDKPPFANDELYDIMLECWSTNPESRPLFYALEKRFARMLGDEVTSHYVDLNDPYLRINNEYMKRTQTDYMALMGSPDEMAPPPPRYVNGHILPEIRIDSSSDDYLQMSPDTGTTIFSPTRPKDHNNISTDDDRTTTADINSFTFPDGAQQPQQQHSPTLTNNLDSPANKNRRKDGVEVQPEEIPMLHQVHSSEGEQSPENPRKFTNMLQQVRPTPTPSPRHHVTETQLTSAAGDGDDYVNVNSPKKLLNNNGDRKADAFYNPSYQMLKTVGEDGKQQQQ